MEDDVVARAQQLAPKLAERARAANELRRVPDETIADFKRPASSACSSRRAGAGSRSTRACSSTCRWRSARRARRRAWVLGVVAVHNWQLALFPLEAQEEVWGQDPTALDLVVLRADGQGRARRGRLSRHRPLVVLERLRSLPVGLPRRPRSARGPKRARRRRCARSSCRAATTASTTPGTSPGCKGTGSKDIVVEDAFVPEHRTHKLIDGYLRKSPGNEVNPAPLYRLPFGQIFVRSVSTSAIGAARARSTSTPASPPSASPRATARRSPRIRRRRSVAAQAAALIDEARSSSTGTSTR